MQTKGFKGDQFFYQKLILYRRNPQIFKKKSKIDTMTLEAERRTPESMSIKSDKKFNSAFTNSTRALSTLVANQIKRFKTRLSISRRKDSISDAESLEKGTTRSTYNTLPQQDYLQKNVRGLNMSLGLSRKSFIEISKDPPDERQFHNYKLKSPDFNHTLDLSKLTKRTEIFIDPNHNDLNYQLGKKYQDYYYKNTNFRTLLNYKLSRKEERKWRFIKREQDISSSDPNVEAILSGFQTITPLKAPQIDQFYNISTNHIPSLLEMRKMTKNQNFWLEDYKEGIHYKRPKLQFVQKQQHNLLKQRRLNAIKQKKKPKIKRQQCCSQYYYKRYKPS